MLAALIDFIGDRWVSIRWSRGPDLFPNGELGYPLAIVQIVAGVLLCCAGVQFGRRRGGVSGILAGVALVVVTGGLSFAAFAFLAPFHQAWIMGRSM